MAVLDNTQALINDALFRAGEIPGASEWDAKALDYINREYRALCAGASEFIPEFVPDWWWMRATGGRTLLPVYNTGFVSAIQGNNIITFNPAPAIDLTGRYFKTLEHPDIFVILNHTPGAADATIETLWTGPTNTATGFVAAKLEYNLNANVSALLSPILSFRENPQIMGLSPERMDTLFPLGRNSLIGVPQAFALEDEQTIRFSHGGRSDGVSMWLKYRYRPSVDDLTNSTSSIPLVPLQFRHVLADMTLVYIYMDKNDDRLTAIGTSVRSTLGAMVRENRRRFTKMDGNAGRVMPRQSRSRRFDRALRTESGLIIG